MFKKIYEEFRELRILIRSYFEKQWEEHVATRTEVYNSANSIKLKMDALHTIESQQRTIEQLTNALKDKYEHGLFIFSEDGKIVTAIQDGEEIMANRMSYLNVEWSVGEAVSVTVERR